MPNPLHRALTGEQTFGTLGAMRRADTERATQLALVPDVPADAPAPIPDGRSGNSLAAYATDLRQFALWCAARHKPALPAVPDDLVAYIAYLAATPPPGRTHGVHAFTTIKRRLLGIRFAHKQAHLTDPTRDPRVSRALWDLRRNNHRPPVPTQPAPVESLMRILDALDSAPVTCPGEVIRIARDRALLLLLYSGALSREEARTLQVGAMTPTAQSVQIEVNRTEFDDRARVVRITAGRFAQSCPIRALQLYLRESGIEDGYLFRGISDGGFVSEKPLSKAQVSRICEVRVRLAGLDPTKLTPQSFRAAVVVQVARSGGTLAQAMEHMGLHDPQSVSEMFRAGKRLSTAEMLGI
jgi:site-specific recombinase XerD